MTARFASPFLLALPVAFVPAPSFAPAAGPDPVSVTLTTGDGVELSARYTAGGLGAKSPAVLILDDLGEEARPWLCDALAKRLAAEGCAVLCFDFRGHGGSREVSPEFWETPTNRQLVKGFKLKAPPESIGFADFKPGYLPSLVNDVAAARAYLEQRNDAGDCNVGQIYLVGFGGGATLGQVWLGSEWSRYRITGFQGKISATPEGRDVAGVVWVDPRPALDRRTVPMFDLIRKASQKKMFVGLIHDAEDAAGAKLARQCKTAFNTKPGSTLALADAVPRDGGLPVAEREGVAERVLKLVANMRKAQQMPPWDDRDFEDRRYVWAFPSSPVVLAKDEGEPHFRPLPVDRALAGR